MKLNGQWPWWAGLFVLVLGLLGVASGLTLLPPPQAEPRKGACLCFCTPSGHRLLGCIPAAAELPDHMEDG